MKKIINAVILVSSLFLVSCRNDLLEPYTPGSLEEEEALTTSNDISLVMNSAYLLLTDRTESVFASVFTDEVGIGYANGGQGITTEYIFFMNSGQSSPIRLWNETYFALARINRVLSYVDKITPVNTTDARRIANLKAQALTVRAYCHLKLMSYFSTNLKDENAPAAVLANRVFLLEEKQNPRATNGEFYSFIHEDLNNAISIFTNNSIAFVNIYANINFARGLKARAFAYKGDYTNAEIWADTVITSSGLTLATQDEYRKLFFNDTQPENSEVIFKFKRTNNQNSQANNLHNGWCSIRPNLAGSPFYEVGRSLHNLLNPNNLRDSLIRTLPDVRANVIIAPSSVVDPNYATSPDYRNSDRLIINKHGGVESGTQTAATTANNGFNNDIKVMRLSEMYMIKAEARTAAGDLAGAALAVKTLLDARFSTPQMVPAFTNATQAWREILKQRRIEFAYEGYRYIDLKRLGTLAGVGIDRDPADYSSSSANYPAGNPSNLPMSSYKWTLPIPQDEINVNKVIQQNPGY
ncbi:RagB/SusD family nutrient uptake outer membrane protein [Chryseobacterium piperi]|nr:RagB/SusD family nutrient uptake outer membrane protein [Chryseobacterium piperi]